MISTLILTKNEEQDLPGCLESVGWCDDVHVFDSHSTDLTVEVATRLGATVTQRAFDGYASHRNAALHGIAFRHPWVLILDADERISPALAEEMCRKVKEAPEETCGFRMRRRDIFMGRWLKHAQITPYYVRLVRPERVHYEREINEVLVVDGAVEELEGTFDHYPFSKGIEHWIAKHNRYSSMEAVRWLEERQGNFEFSWKEALLAKDPSVRRYHQKGLFYGFPGRPLIKFAYMMLGRRAFLDGGPGVAYAILQSIYEYFIVLKQKELLARSRDA
jgi:glycosyltransferase involved in cell wall biosynthesis